MKFILLRWFNNNNNINNNDGYNKQPNTKPATIYLLYNNK